MNKAHYFTLSMTLLALAAGCADDGSEDPSFGVSEDALTDLSGQPGVEKKYEKMVPKESNFRNNCTISHISRDDSIVHYGKPGAAHGHMFWGNRATDAFTTVDNVRSLNKGATCHGDPANLSAYWAPILLDKSGNTLLPPGNKILVYYKAAGLRWEPEKIEPFPKGLRMITDEFAYKCSSSNSKSQTIPACPQGKTVTFEVFFKQCWDGKNLDSPDHRSHLADTIPYTGPGAVKNQRTCPASHPVRLPQLSYKYTYNVTASTGTSGWHLSSDGPHSSKPGASMHADFLYGWNPIVKEAWVDGCIRNPHDCANGRISNDWTLIQPAKARPITVNLGPTAHCNQSGPYGCGTHSH